MDIEFDPETGVLTMTRPFSGKRTLRYLVEGDEVEGKHRRTCHLTRTMRRLKADPDLLG